MADLSYERKEQIGNHTLYLADCVRTIDEIGRVNAIVTDPPYSSGGLHMGARQASTSLKYTKKAYAEFMGDHRDQLSHQWWLTQLLSRLVRRHASRGCFVGLFSDWRQFGLTSNVLQASGVTFRGCFVWDKTEAVRPMNGRHRNQCEFVLWGHVGSAINNGVYAPGVFRGSVQSNDKIHPTQKTVPLMAAVMKPCGETVFDPFMGSGTTGVACQQTGRRFIGIEADPHYFDVACRRIEASCRQGRLFD